VPSANPFAPVVETGVNASVGPVSGNLSTGFGLTGGAGDHHVSAGIVLLGLVILVLLWKSKFRFSTTVG
jgi:hypothetical protein